MIFILIFLLFVCLKNIKFYSLKNNASFNKNAFSKDFSQTINGIFVLLVFLSHFSQYVVEVFVFDKVALLFLKFLGQCINCSFLFYSGFGICEQLKQNQNEYCKKLILKRFPTLFLRFDFCVFLYLILSFILEKNYSVQKILLSFVGIESIGNSSWYIFYILLCYILVFLCFKIFKNQKIAVFTFTFVMIFYTILMFCFCKEKTAYYLTTLIFPFGMIFSLYKEKIQNLLLKKYVLFLIFSFGLYFLSFFIRRKFNLSEPFYNFTAIFFSMILIVLTLKIEIKSKVLAFLGNNVFYIYILQRLPMICWSEICGGGAKKIVIY